MLRAIHRVPQDVGRGRVLAGNAYLLPCEIPTPESSCAAGCTEARPPDHGQMKVWSDAAKRCGSTGVGLRLPSLNGSSGPRRNADSKRICAFSRIYSHAPNHSAPANSMARVPHPGGRGVFAGKSESVAQVLDQRDRIKNPAWTNPLDATHDPQSSLLALCSAKSSGCMGSFVIRGGTIEQN